MIKMIGADLLERVIDWLLQGEPWVEYRTRVDLLGQLEGEPEVARAKRDMVDHFKIKALLEGLKGWQGSILSSHRSADQPFHRLSFIADLGLRRGDPCIDEIVARIFEHRSEEGPFQLAMSIPEHFGGSGTSRWAWALCDAPVVIYSLAKLGFEKDALVQKVAGYLASLAHGNGWPCVVSKELDRFRGPGKKGDPCPYATLVMLKMLLQFERWIESEEVSAGSESLLSLWARSRELHPYMFYMGTDFRKLKAPFVWYDILHVLDTLSQLTWLRGDPRLQEMAELLRSKANPEGKYVPESHWKVWSGWDFGQKKEPSRWLTFLVFRILKRLGA